MPNRLKSPIVAIRRLRLLPRWVRRMDAAAARRINHRVVHPSIDRAYLGVSRAADSGRLWFAIAGVLLLLGRDRAAIRGVASLAVGSILANLVGKKIFGGDRPLLKDIPIGRRLRKSPTSGSFPSGHSASAAGFAIGVALESPRTGAAIAPLAGAVAYSRLHTGAHWLSDVIGGAALGAGVAALGKVLVPARRVKLRESPTANEQRLPVSADGDGVLIVVNPSSGRDSGRPDPVPLLRGRLPKAIIHELSAADDLDAIVRGATGVSVLGAYGGDGTIARAADVARRRGWPLLVLPGGTFNHFAQTAGIPDISAAVDAFQAGHGRQVDVAELSFRQGSPITVLNTASVGIYPYFVAEREKRERTIGKRLAALVAAIGVVTIADPIEATIGGKAVRVWSIFVGVNKYYRETAAPLQRRRLDDGVLDVRILHAGPKARMTAIIELAFGRRAVDALRRVRLWRAAPAVERITTEALTVSVRARHDHDPGFAHDGEASLHTPGGPAADGGYESTLRIVPRGLTIYAPPRD